MTVRHRVQSATDDMGRAFWSLFGTTFRDESGNYVKHSKVCDDVVDGTHNDHVLEINEQRIEIEVSDLVNGLLDNGVHYKLFRNYVPDFYQYTTFGHLTVDLPPDAATALAARTNPSRPHVALPMLVQDLVEIPSLLKSAGETLIRGGANAFLSYNYGWKPLIEDVKSVVQFQQNAAQTSDELHRLWGNGGLKRRITLGTGFSKNDVGEFNIVDSGSSAWVSCWKDIHTTAKQWGTIRWIPDVLPPRTEKEYAAIAMRGAYGIETLERTASALPWQERSASRLSHLYNQAWQLLPWSWMSDWMANLGDYFAAYDNSIPAHALGINIMTKTETVYTFTRREDLSETWTTGGGARVFVSQKKRSQSTPSISASLPFLSGNQMSILGALGIQRLPRSRS